MNLQLEKNSFSKRLKSMIAVDFRRMFTSSLFYIMLAVSIVLPILILVMTTMMDGTVSVDPQTGKETVIEGFKNVWQIIGSKNSENASMTMDLTSMCNINMMFFLIAVFVCLFVSADFRSGYSKNLFTVRANKLDYVVSKSIIGFTGGALMLITFFVGAIIGGKISGLSFALDGVTAGNLCMSMLSKIFLVAIFSSIYLVASVVAKEKLWLSLILSFGVGMLFYTMVPIITPLNANAVNVILSLAGSAIFSVGIGVGSYYILKKSSLA